MKTIKQPKIPTGKSKNESSKTGMLYGWICPRCGKVHSPYSTNCDCPPESKVWTGTSTKTDVET